MARSVFTSLYVNILERTTVIVDINPATVTIIYFEHCTMASSAESKEENVETIGNDQFFKPGQKNSTPAPGNGGSQLI